jgi:crotonobetainyl-CoA hydratase
LIAGTAGSFCAGADLKDRAAQPLPPGGFGGLTRRFDLDKPIIAAVDGPALGGGFELVLACDIAVGTPRALFGLPEPHVGRFAPTGVQRLPRAIGQSRAAEIALTGRRVGAEEALALGILARLVPSEGVMTAALALARALCAASPFALAATKAAMRAGSGLALADALAVQEGLPAVRRLAASSHGEEGGRAFAEKRPPVWRDS